MFVAGHLCASPAENAVKEFYSLLFSKRKVETEKFIENLRSFEASFNNQFLPEQKGFVDAGGRYMIVGSEIINMPLKMRELISKSTPLPMHTHIFNLLAYELNTPPQKKILFVDKNDRYVILGGQVINMITGKDTFSLANIFIPHDLANFLYSQRNTTGSFLQGKTNARKTIFVFNEPNCPMCRDLYEGLKPFVNSGELSIHWNPITFISPTSRGKAWAILDGDVPNGADFDHTPAGALAFNEENFINPETGGIPPTRHPTDEAAIMLNRNEQFFLVAGLPGTPFIIYKNINDIPAYLFGLPSNFADFVDNVFVHKSLSD